MLESIGTVTVVQTTRLRITMRDVEPRVVRVVDVPVAATLAELHDLLQVALGWTDSHLHMFEVGGTRYGVPDPDWDAELRPEDEATVLLREMPERFEYHYDFGDSWEHTVEVVGVGDEVPGCVEGEGACPPEDCGGAPGYEHMLEVLADPGHEEYEHLREWAGELPVFDQEATSLLVRQTVGEVPASVRIVLDLLAGGVKADAGWATAAGGRAGGAGAASGVVLAGPACVDRGGPACAGGAARHPAQGWVGPALSRRATSHPGRERRSGGRAAVASLVRSGRV